MDKESDLNILLLLMSKENPYVLAVNFIAVTNISNKDHIK